MSLQDKIQYVVGVLLILVGIGIIAYRSVTNIDMTNMRLLVTFYGDYVISLICVLAGCVVAGDAARRNY